MCDGKWWEVRLGVRVMPDPRGIGGVSLPWTKGVTESICTVE